MTNKTKVPFNYNTYKMSEVTFDTVNLGDILKYDREWDEVAPVYYEVVGLARHTLTVKMWGTDGINNALTKAFCTLTPSWTFHEIDRKRNPEHLRWVAQVNVNYHEGLMSEEDAEYLAGQEPPRFLAPTVPMD